MRRTFLDTYHIGDARKLSEFLPSKAFVDVTVTSPPYWNLKDYGSREQVGFGQQYEYYLDDLEQIFKRIYCLTKKTGSLWVVADTIKRKGELKLFPFDLAQRLKNVGWSLHDIIIWNKDKTLPWSHRGKLRNIFEYILFFSKGKRFKYRLSQVREAHSLKRWWIRYPERYSPQGKAPTRTWSIPIPRQGSWGENWVRHFCPFPPDLVRRIVLLTTKKGDVVLDPFSGSGVVLAEAKALGRHYVGLDLRKSYRQMFRRRVLPWVVSLEARNSGVRLEEEKKRKTFSGLIWRLRKTKYPRELIRLYEKQNGTLSVLGVLALSPRLKSLSVTLVFSDSKRPSSNVLSRLKKLMFRPPLSKYGLRVTLSTVLLGNLEKKTFVTEGIRPEMKLNLYEKGKTYHSAREISAGEFLESLKKTDGPNPREVPTIASNLYVRVPRKMFA